MDAHRSHEPTGVSVVASTSWSAPVQNLAEFRTVHGKPSNPKTTGAHWDHEPAPGCPNRSNSRTPMRRWTSGMAVLHPALLRLRQPRSRIKAVRAADGEVGGLVQEPERWSPTRRVDPTVSRRVGDRRSMTILSRTCGTAPTRIGRCKELRFAYRPARPKKSLQKTERSALIQP